MIKDLYDRVIKPDSTWFDVTSDTLHAALEVLYL